MDEPLLSGINHVTLAATNIDITIAFYEDVFRLESTDFSVPGEARSALLVFPNGSFVQVCSAATIPATTAPLSATPGNLLHDGAPLDHFSLFATGVDALEVIRARLMERGATDGEIIDTAGVAKTVRFTDPDGRLVEVTAY